MKIELTTQQMQRLLSSGLLHPSDIACLDLETRNQLKAMCLKLCQPSHCATCEMQALCQQPYKTLSDAFPHAHNQQQEVSLKANREQFSIQKLVSSHGVS